MNFDDDEFTTHSSSTFIFYVESEIVSIKISWGFLKSKIINFVLPLSL